MKKLQLTIVLCLACILQLSAQVNVLFETYGTKYYESMNAETPPADGWAVEAFDDSEWSNYTGSMTFPEYDAFWVRSRFIVTDYPAGHSYVLRYAHDDEGIFYVNGHAVHGMCGGCGSEVSIPNGYLHIGVNVIAAYTRDFGGNQFLEFTVLCDNETLSLPKETMMLMSESSYKLFNVDDSRVNQKLISASVLSQTGYVDAVVTWTSSDSSVATVENGLVQAVGAGQAVITASAMVDGVTYSKTCTISVDAVPAGTRMVYVETPGTLPTLISEAEKDEIESLFVIGEINGTDVKFLREMAGCDAQGILTGGVLSSLNLYNAKIVSGGDPYWNRTNEGTYNTENDVVGVSMFRKCNSLMSIVLPKDTRRTESYAFRECKFLQKVVLNDGLEQIGYESFSNCSNLLSIDIPQSVTRMESYAFANCPKLEEVNFADDAILSYIGSACFSSTGIQRVVIPKRVKEMEGSVFNDCRKLISVVFEEGIELASLPDYIFQSCSELKEVVLSQSLREIGEYAFNSCTSLGSIDLPTSVVTVENGAFGDCYQLTNINIPEGSKLSNIGESAFAYCYTLQSFSLPKQVKSIGDNVFYDCYNLSSFIIPQDSKLMSIGENAFSRCKLTSLYIPQYVTSLEGSNFDNESLQEITAHPDNNIYKVYGGALYNKKTNALICIPQSISGTYRTPDFMTSLPDNALRDKRKLTAVVLSSKITLVGANAFSGCGNLRELYVLGAVPPSLKNNSFDGFNSQAVTLYVPLGQADTYVNAGWNCFAAVVECPEQPEVRLSKQEVTLYDLQQEDVRQAHVTAMVLTAEGPSDAVVTWTSVDETVATVQDGLITLVAAGETDIQASVTIDGQTYTASCHVHGIAVEDGANVYYVNAGNLQSLISESEKYSITDLTLLGTINADDVRFLRDMAGIGNNYNSTSGKLARLNIESVNVVSGGNYNNPYNGTTYCEDGNLGHGAFSRCSALQEVILPSTLSALNNDMFAGCRNLMKVVLPDGLTEINSGLFYECNSLTDVTIPSSVTSIGSNVFVGTSVKNLFIPRLVNTIANQTFPQTFEHIEVDPLNKSFEVVDSYLVNKLAKTLAFVPMSKKKLNIPSNVTTIPEGVLQGHTNLETIVLPASLSKIEGWGPFSSCDNLKAIYSFTPVSPTHDENCFTCNFNAYNVALYVPEEVVEAYQNASGWNEFQVQAAKKQDAIDIAQDSVRLIDAFGAREQLLSYNIDYTTGPSDDEVITWSSSDTTVVAVNEAGKLTFVGEGKATIEVSVILNGVTCKDVCQVEAIGTADPEHTYYLTGDDYCLRNLIDEEHKYKVDKLVLMGTMSNGDREYIGEMTQDHNEDGIDVPSQLRTLDMSQLSNTALQSWSFNGCKSLENVTLPDGLKSLESNVFSSCPNLTVIEFPATLESMISCVFEHSSNIKALIFNSQSAPSTNGDAFYGLDDRDYVIVVPVGAADAYKSQGEWSNKSNIYDRSTLPILLLSDNVLSLYNCEIEEIAKRQLSVTAISDRGIFAPEVQWESSNVDVASVSETGLVVAGQEQGDAIIKASVVIDGKLLEAECTISNVVMSDGKIIYMAEAGTLNNQLTEDEKDNLKKIVIFGPINGDDIRVLRYMAGRDEYGSITIGMLEDLNMSEANLVYGGEGYYTEGNSWWNCSPDNIGYKMFNGCGSLKNVVLPKNTRVVESYAFHDCENLETIVLPEGLYHIGYEAFANCVRLQEIILPSTLTGMEGYAFNGCRKLASADLSKLTTLSTIPYGTFHGTGLKTITIPSCITQISEDAFNNSKLESVTFAPDANLSVIGYNAFLDNKLTSVDLPASVTRIEQNAFRRNADLVAFNIPEDSKLTTLGDNFINETSVKKLYISRRITSIAGQDFPATLETIEIDPLNKAYEIYAGCLVGKLSKTLVYVPKTKTLLTMPEYVTTISGGVLSNHNNLETIILPTSLRKIEGWGPFSECTSLQRIYCNNPEPPTHDENCFTCNFGAYNVALYVPESAVEAYQDASGWNEFNIKAATFKDGIDIAEESIRLYNANGGKEVQLTCIIESAGGVSEIDRATWTTSDVNVAVVSENGVVSFVGGGKATITATIVLNDVSYSDVCQVEAIEVPTSGNSYYVNPGTLSSIITAEDKADISDIVLFGSLNSDDIRFLREWAGCSYWSYEGNSDNNGTLKSIDMSNVNIVEGGSTYCYGYYLGPDGTTYSSDAHTQNDVIGHNFFAGSNSLTHIVLPENITSIGDYAFRNCPNLTSIVIPSTVRIIGARAFDNCPALEGIFTLTANIDSLGYRALGGYTLVRALSETPVKLGGDALVGDDGLVIVPASALASYRQAEHWKEFASRIYPDDINLQTTVDMAVTAGEDHSGLVNAMGSEDALAFVQNLTLHGTINSYDIFAIRNRMPRLQNLNLSDVNIVANPFEYYTDSHTEKDRLGQNAFRELKNLRNVVLPKSIKYIGAQAFYQCTSLQSIVCGDKLVTIDEGAFQNCSSLKNIELHEGLLSIGDNAFSQCSTIEEVVLPSSVHALGRFAFYDCYALKSMVLPSSLTSIEHYTFAYCHKLESVVIPSRVNTIDYNSFYGCEKLTEVRIPPMVERIGNDAFGSCNNIKDVYVYIANPRDIKIDMNTFSCWTTATLHIPTFSYNAYYWDTQWGQFYSKVEFEDSYESFYTKNTLVLNQETGVIDGDPDATLYEQGGLVVEDETQTLGEVDLKSNGTDGASLIASGDGQITADKLNITINVEAYKWHFFSFPFDIMLDSINYDGDYVWRQYDGAKRSRREGGWQDIAEDATKLEKGRGYIFQGTSTGELKICVGKQELTAADHTSDLDINASTEAQDAGWNFMGNPYTSYYEVTEDTYAAPITIWTGDHYEAYRPGDDDYSLAPYQAFFVQASDDQNTLNFSSDNQSSYTENKEAMSQARARRAARKTNPSRLLINLEIAALGDSVAADKSRIVFNNNKSIDYEVGCDASKFESESSKVEIYTVDGHGTRYAINERPVNEGAVTMGITARVAGTYTISATRMDQEVWIVDNVEGVTHNLSLGEYEFDTAKGDYPNRFTIRMSNEPTNIDDFFAKTGVSIDTSNGVTISGVADNTKVQVYNLSGVLMANQNGNTTVSVPSGTYIVKVGSIPVKVMVKN